MRIYKKTLAIQLIKNGHDLHHTERNRYCGKYQVFYFQDSDELYKDVARLNNQVCKR